VEVGGTTGDAFEAQAVDISREGMHLRTAYLPDLGQPISCRFEIGKSTVVSEGMVIWKHDAEQGGEFGIQFTNLDPESKEILGRILGEGGGRAAGTKIRLHIDGLGSPMRARVKDSHGARVTAFSELGFLQVGKELELEDAASGQKRPAQIRNVEVELDPQSHVPQLVVSMKYADQEDDSADVDGRKEATPEPSVIGSSGTASGGEHEARATSAADLEGEAMKSPVARTMAKVTPALLGMASKAKESVSAFIQKRREKPEAAAPRRATSPPPGGGLHASGRRVVRSSKDEEETAVAAPEGATAFAKKHKRRLAIAGAVFLAGTLAYAGLHKSEPATKDPNATAAAEGSGRTTAAGPQAPAMPQALSLPQPIAPSGGAGALNMVPDQLGTGSPGADDDGNDTPDQKKGKPVPFGHGNVSHGNVIHIKMDGNIERIQGAMQPTGFTVVIPKRKSLTSGGAISKQDKRIGLTKVINDGNGVELNVTFKDGVPPYVVRAKKDILEVVLGKSGAADDKAGDNKGDAKPEGDGKPGGKHGGHHKKHDTKHGGQKKH
jgi:hypothetical protein